MTCLQPRLVPGQEDDEYNDGDRKISTFTDEALLAAKPTYPGPPASVRLQSIQSGEIPLSRKAEALDIARRALDIFPHDWGRYPMLRVDVICCLEGTTQVRRHSR